MKLVLALTLGVSLEILRLSPSSYKLASNVLFTGLPRMQMSDDPLTVYAYQFDLVLIPWNNSEALI